jgi:predicted metal-dependent HD superfamily phosphohydrolase
MGSDRSASELRQWRSVIRSPRFDQMHAQWAKFVAAACNDNVKSAAIDRWYVKLARDYSHRERAYHNLEHIRNVIAWVAFLLNDQHPKIQTAAMLAAWFHDVIYETTKSDNEEKSVRMMKRAAIELALPTALVEKAFRLILLTKSHKPPKSTAASAFMDADLAILGSPPSVYKRYVRSVRIEYAWVEPAAFREGRTKVLRAFLNRRQIYQTEIARRMLEQSARRNIKWELTTINHRR